MLKVTVITPPTLNKYRSRMHTYMQVGYKICLLNIGKVLTTNSKVVQFYWYVSCVGTSDFYLRQLYVKASDPRYLWVRPYEISCQGVLHECAQISIFLVNFQESSNIHVVGYTHSVIYYSNLVLQVILYKYSNNHSKSSSIYGI